METQNEIVVSTKGTAHVPAEHAPKWKQLLNLNSAQSKSTPASLQAACERVNAFRLAKLAMHPGLSKWQRGFVHDALARRKLSPRQLRIVERMVRQYLEGRQ